MFNLNLISKQRNNILGLATLMILVFHLWIISFRNVFIIENIEFYIKNISYIGVDIFFLLSGFGCYCSITKIEKGFIKRRIKRITLPFLSLSIVEGIVKNWSLKTFFINITSYGFWFININTYKWFIFAIFICYLFTPLYIKIMKRITNKFIFTISISLIIFILSFLFRKYIRSDFYSFIYRIPAYIFGIYLANLNSIKEIQIKYIYLICTLIVEIVFSYLIMQNFIKIKFLDLIYFINLPLVITFIFVISYKLEKYKAFFLKEIGSSSLIIYLIHELLGEILINNLYGIIPRIILNFCVFTIIVVTGYCFNLFFENLMYKK